MYQYYSEVTNSVIIDSFDFQIVRSNGANGILMDEDNV
jgi:hypothetical protein